MTSDGIAYVLITLALVLAVIGYTFRRPALGFASAGFWIILAVFSLDQSTAVWDIYYGLFWVSIGVAIVVALETFVLRPKKEDDELHGTLEHDSWEDYAEKTEAFRNKIDRIRRPTRRRQIERRNEEDDKKRIRRMMS